MAANSKFAMATHIMTLIAHASTSKEVEKDSHGLVRSELIAGSVNTNPVVVRRIVSILAKAGLVISHQGKGGGLELAKSPSQISLLDIYNALGEEPIFAVNPNLPNPACEVSVRMPEVLDPVFQSAKESLQANLKKTKLSDLLKQI